MPKTLSPQKIWQDWDFVEKKIEKEAQWLHQNISTFLKEETSAPRGCNDCFIRKIAILIVSGGIIAKNISKSPTLKDFWINEESSKMENKIKIFHGMDWHQEKMKTIENHFLMLGFEVVREPAM
ncbi:MAG: hypothetical protein NTV62_00785, partial [Candidatus Gribaldobacteria bacterium]|nr:hypothetical protein [Candidatus Gribaldobacteria bacterium]